MKILGDKEDALWSMRKWRMIPFIYYACSNFILFLTNSLIWIEFSWEWKHVCINKCMGLYGNLTVFCTITLSLLTLQAWASNIMSLHGKSMILHVSYAFILHCKQAKTSHFLRKDDKLIKIPSSPKSKMTFRFLWIYTEAHHSLGTLNSRHTQTMDGYCIVWYYVV